MAGGRMNAQCQQQIAKLEAQLAQVRDRKRMLEGEETGLVYALAVLRGAEDETVPPTPSTRAETRSSRQPRGVVKDVSLRLLQEHIERGLTVNEVVELAAKEQIELDRGSVSSLLSRLKNENLLTHDGQKYRIASMEKPTVAPITPIRAA